MPFSSPVFPLPYPTHLQHWVCSSIDFPSSSRPAAYSREHVCAHTEHTSPWSSRHWLSPTSLSLVSFFSHSLAWPFLLWSFSSNYSLALPPTSKRLYISPNRKSRLWGMTFSTSCSLYPQTCSYLLLKSTCFPLVLRKKGLFNCSWLIYSNFLPDSLEHFIISHS